MKHELPWLTIAKSYIGTKEIKGTKHNPVILGLWELAFKATHQPVQTVFKNDEIPWCGGFVGGVLAKANLGKHIPKHFAMAKAWLNAGTKLDRAAYGCVVIFWRGTPKSASGHVGFVVGQDQRGNLMVLGGNQGDSVNIKPFAKNRVLGYRWCGTQTKPAAFRYGLPVVRSDGKLSTNEQ